MATMTAEQEILAKAQHLTDLAMDLAFTVKSITASEAADACEICLEALSCRRAGDYDSALELLDRAAELLY